MASGKEYFWCLCDGDYKRCYGRGKNCKRCCSGKIDAPRNATGDSITQTAGFKTTKTMVGAVIIVWGILSLFKWANAPENARS